MNAPDKAFLSREYNNRELVPEHAAFFARWDELSARARSRMTCYLDRRYGDAPGETIDIFPARKGDGTCLMFIHGGYWRALDKKDFSFLAPAWVDAGVSLAVVNYDLCPRVSVDEIVRQMLRASRWLWQNAEEYGMDQDRLYVGGHSAGGHLTAMLMAALWPVFDRSLPKDLWKGGLAISGLYDLRPLVEVDWLNADLRLDAESALRLSPAFLPPATRAPVDVRWRRRVERIPASECAPRQQPLALGVRRRHRHAGQEPFLGDGRARRAEERALRGRAPPHEARQMIEYRSSARYIDSAHSAVQRFSKEHARGGTEKERAVALYYAVRDQVRYNPFLDFSRAEVFRASSVLECGQGFCIGKAALLAASARAAGIAARVGFADVKNHLTTPRLAETMGSDLFVYHGYTEMHIDGRWVKATPAFNLELCKRFRVKPLEFDGREDSIFHPFDEDERRHMEYLRDRGVYADVPVDEIQRAFREAYPKFYALGADAAKEIFG